MPTASYTVYFDFISRNAPDGIFSQTAYELGRAVGRRTDDAEKRLKQFVVDGLLEHIAGKEYRVLRPAMVLSVATKGESGPFSEDDLERIKVLWAQGYAAAEIGRHIGRTKNAVVGKVHRLDLPARPSPIRRSGEEQQPRVRAVGNARTIPALPSEVAFSAIRPEPPVCVAPLPAPKRAPPVTHRFTLAPARPRPEPVVKAAVYGRVIECCWPIGEPGTAAFRFCEEPSAPAKSYCPSHSAQAYVRVRRPADEAVA